MCVSIIATTLIVLGIFASRHLFITKIGSDDGLNVWELTAVPKGESVLIDFSPKGGPKDLLGKWDGSGIVFPGEYDGSKRIFPFSFDNDYNNVYIVL